MFFFFFKQKTAYEMRISDWSSDGCSSDLQVPRLLHHRGVLARSGGRARSIGHRAQGPPQHQALHAPAHPRALPRRVADGPGPALLRLEVVPRQREHFAAEAELEAGEAALALGVEAAEVEDRKSTRLNSSH